MTTWHGAYFAPDDMLILDNIAKELGITSDEVILRAVRLAGSLRAVTNTIHGVITPHSQRDPREVDI